MATPLFSREIDDLRESVDLVGCRGEYQILLRSAEGDRHTGNLAW